MTAQLMIFYILRILSGNWDFSHFRKEDFKLLKDKIILLIEKIGVTQGIKGEIKNFHLLPI